MKKSRTKTVRGWGPIKYVTIKNVPVRYSEKHGEIIDMSPHEIERRIAVALLEHRVPICGNELKILKSAIGLSFEEMANSIGVSKNSLVTWVKKEDQRLAIVHEIAIRVLASEFLGVELHATLDDLVADDKARKINIEAA